MADFRDELAIIMFGRPRHGRLCVTCGNKVGEFRDDLSRREYGISGMCQVCQDSVFDSCPYCGGDCPLNEENACDGFLGDIDNLCVDNPE